MRKFLIFLSCLALTLSISGVAKAVSPVPDEIENNAKRKAFEKAHPGQNEAVCSIKIVSSDKPAGEYFAPIVFEGALTKKEVLEKVVILHGDSLEKDDVSVISIECKFPNTK